MSTCTLHHKQPTASGFILIIAILMANGCSLSVKEALHPYASFKYQEFYAIKNSIITAHLKFDHQGKFQYSESGWILPLLRFNTQEGKYHISGQLIHLNWYVGDPQEIYTSLSSFARLSDDGKQLIILLPDTISPCWTFKRK